MHAIWLIPAVFAVLSTVAGANADSLDDAVRAEMKARHIPGLAFAVVRDGRVVRTGAYGCANLEHQVPVTLRTRFPVHSVSKQFCAAAVLMAAEEGRLALDDPMAAYLDGVPEEWRGITLRQLLQMTSGLPDYLNDYGLDTPEEGGLPEFFRVLKEKGGKRPAPGETWEYCNTSYMLLAKAVKKATGRTTTDILQERVFAPLGMQPISINSISNIIPNRAQKYNWKDGRWVNAEFPYDCQAVSDSGLIISMEDLAKWAAALDTGRILSPGILKEMWTPGRLNDGSATEYGMAWFIDNWRGKPRIYHEGASFNGERAIIARYPESRLSVVMADNGGNPNLGLLAGIIASRFDKALAPPHLMKPSKDPDPARTAALEKCLRDLAATGESDLLSPAAPKSAPEARKSRAAERYKGMTSATYIGEDALPAGGPCSLVVYLKVPVPDAVWYVSMFLDGNGKLVGWESYRRP